MITDNDTSLLESICGRDGRDSTARPYLVTVDGSPWRGATDGRRLLMLAGADDECRDTEPAPSEINRIFVAPPTPAWTTSREALCQWAGTDDGICPHCHGRGGASENRCPECEGDGELECDLGHTHDCDECDGTGWVDGPCPECKGRLGRRAMPGWLSPLGVLVNRALLAGVVSRLPGDIVHVGVEQIGSTQVIALYGPGWLLKVVGLTRTTQDDPPAITLRLAPLSTASQSDAAVEAGR